MTERTKKEQTLFHSLTPERVLSPVEKALGVRCTNLCRPLNSYINRVFELEGEDGRGLVAKFYRPGRWSASALQDEHDFLRDLHAAEIPVVAPLVHTDGETLGVFEGLHFAVFPKKSGRSFDEFSDEQWLQLGRLLGRTHLVGGPSLAPGPDHHGARCFDPAAARLPSCRPIHPGRPGGSVQGSLR